jgi:7-cyano-7-deazaguanine reductase
MPTRPSKELVTVPNPYAGREYEVSISCPEFTCLCPMTSQPDFAEIRIHYVPGERLIELKALKLYLWSYRDEGAFHEAVVNQVLDDLVAACQPVRMEVVGDFNVRGGIKTVVTARYDHEEARQLRAA